MTTEETPSPSVDPEAPVGPDTWIERFVLPYFTESMLWPVLVALLGHVVVVLALPMAQAWRTRSLVWVAVVFLLAAISFWPVQSELGRKRRPGAVSVAIGGTWLAAAIVAALGVYTDVF
jgi:hypothetical protein